MTARIRKLAIGAAIVAAVLGQVVPAQAATTVRARCLTFSPSSVTISKGAKVIWKATCNSHTVTAWSSNWSKDTTIALGQTTSRIFKSTGVFKYRCRFHSSLSNGHCNGMCGRITVTS